MTDDQAKTSSPGEGKIIRVSAGLYEGDVAALNALAGSLDLPRAVLLRQAVGDFVRRVESEELELSVGPEGGLVATSSSKKADRDRSKSRKGKPKAKRKKARGKKKKKKKKKKS